jgi:serine/threonine protein kinase
MSWEFYMRERCHQAGLALSFSMMELKDKRRSSLVPFPSCAPLLVAEYFHCKKILHRDLKLANILV